MPEADGRPLFARRVFYCAQNGGDRSSNGGKLLNDAHLRIFDVEAVVGQFYVLDDGYAYKIGHTTEQVAARIAGL